MYFSSNNLFNLNYNTVSKPIIPYIHINDCYLFNYLKIDINFFLCKFYNIFYIDILCLLI